jgi:MFS transporter, UMF1 family
VSWYLYEWGSSAFSTSVLTVLLGPYLTAIAIADAQVGFVEIVGLAVRPSSLYPDVLSASLASRLILLPWLTVVADLRGWTKEAFAICAYVGALATMGMFWLGSSNAQLGALLLFTAYLAFGIGSVFYNSLLPFVTGDKSRESVSAWGWTAGFAGGGIMLAAHLIFLDKAPLMGLEDSQSVRYCLLSSGAWWAAFATIPIFLIRVPAGGQKSTEPLMRSVTHQFRKLVFREMNSQIRRFLAARAFIETGVLTVMFMAAAFGREELNMPMQELAAGILVVQFVGVCGPLLFNRLAGAIGADKALTISLAAWIAVLISTSLFVRSAAGFFLACAAIAIVLGGSESLSRALFSKLVPHGKEAEFFGAYELASAALSWAGPFLFGVVLQESGSYRVAVLSPVVFLTVGLVLFRRLGGPVGAGLSGRAPGA